jgi:hypothetical protein
LVIPKQLRPTRFLGAEAAVRLLGEFKTSGIGGGAVDVRVELVA